MALSQFLLFLIQIIFAAVQEESGTKSLLVVTVATDETDGYIRWEESVKRHNLDHMVIRNSDCNLYRYHNKVVGMGEEWKGGDVANGPGGAHKINLLKNALDKYKGRSDLLILFTDAYDVVVTGTEKEILDRYEEMNTFRENKMKGISSHS